MSIHTSYEVIKTSKKGCKPLIYLAVESDELVGDSDSSYPR